MKYLPFVRRTAALVSVSLLSTNVLFAYSPESNFWAQRLKNTVVPTVAKLPPTPIAAVKRPSKPISGPIVKSLPAAFGNVRRVSIQNKSSNAKTVIHIQDVHLNAEAQHNIGKTIEDLIINGRIDMVALEGAFEPIDFSVYRNFPYPQSTKAVADFLLKRNKISGAVHTGFTIPGAIPAFVGVDQLDHYNANVEAYRASSPLVKSVKAQLTVAAKDLSKKKTQTFNSELLAFDTKVQSYRNGEMDWGSYVKILSSLSENSTVDIQIFLEALSLESSLDFDAVERQRIKLISEVISKLSKKESNELLEKSAAYKTSDISHADFYQYIKALCKKSNIDLKQHKAMAAYIQYVMLSDAINVDKVMADAANLESSIYASLTKTKEEKDLIDASRNLYLTNKLADFSLTNDEWNEYNSSIYQPSAISQQQILSSFKKFYSEAKARDLAMTSNLMKAMDRSQSKVAVLVAGGFHSNGIFDQLTREGINVISFSPKITRVEDTSGSTYLNVFTQEKTPLDRMFAGEKLFIPPHVTTPAQPTEILHVLHALAADPKLNPDDLSKLKPFTPSLPENAKASVDRSAGDVEASLKTEKEMEKAVVDPNSLEIKEAGQEDVTPYLNIAAMFALGGAPFAALTTQEFTIVITGAAILSAMIIGIVVLTLKLQQIERRRNKPVLTKPTKPVKPPSIRPTSSQSYPQLPVAPQRSTSKPQSDPGISQAEIASIIGPNPSMPDINLGENPEPDPVNQLSGVRRIPAEQRRINAGVKEQISQSLPDFSLVEDFVNDGAYLRDLFNEEKFSDKLMQNLPVYLRHMTNRAEKLISVSNRLATKILAIGELELSLRKSLRSIQHDAVDILMHLDRIRDSVNLVDVDMDVRVINFRRAMSQINILVRHAKEFVTHLEWINENVQPDEPLSREGHIGDFQGLSASDYLRWEREFKINSPTIGRKNAGFLQDVQNRMNDFFMANREKIERIFIKHGVTHEQLENVANEIPNLETYFYFIHSRVNGPRTYMLGSRDYLAVDIMHDLRALEGQGNWPPNLIEEYVLHEILERAALHPGGKQLTHNEIIQITQQLFDRADYTPNQTPNGQTTLGKALRRSIAARIPAVPLIDVQPQSEPMTRSMEFRFPILSEKTENAGFPKEVSYALTRDYRQLSRVYDVVHLTRAELIKFEEITPAIADRVEQTLSSHGLHLGMSLYEMFTPESLERLDSLLQRPLSDLKLNGYARMFVENKKLEIFRDLVLIPRFDVQTSKNVGPVAVDRFSDSLAQYGLWLGMKLESVVPSAAQQILTALDTPVQNIEFSEDAMRFLKDQNLITVRRIVDKSRDELLTLAADPQIVEEIAEKITQLGLRLGMPIGEIYTPQKLSEMRKLLNEPWSKFNFNIRARKAFSMLGARDTLRQVVALSLSDLRAAKGVGQTSVQGIVEKLNELGLWIGMKVPSLIATMLVLRYFRLTPRLETTDWVKADLFSFDLGRDLPLLVAGLLASAIVWLFKISRPTPGITADKFVKKIRREYILSGAQEKLMYEVMRNIRLRSDHAPVSFEVARAFSPMYYTESFKTEKAFAIGLALAIKLKFGTVVSSWGRALKEAFKTTAQVAIVVHVDKMTDMDKVRAALLKARSEKGSVVGVILNRDVPFELIVAVDEMIDNMGMNDRAKFIREFASDFEGNKIPYANVFLRLGNLFMPESEGQTMFMQLAWDDVNDKRLIVMGVPTTSYMATQKLYTILINLVQVDGKILLLNIWSVLEAAKMA